MDKKTELELKKAKLEQIRKERNQRAAVSIIICIYFFLFFNNNEMI